MMPLEVVYVHDKRKANKALASFGFGSGTLQGHLLVSAFSLVKSHIMPAELKVLLSLQQGLKSCQ